MITVKGIFDLLATGELTNTGFKHKFSGGLNENDYGKITNNINLGLIELYKRFNLLQHEVDLYVCPANSVYYLRDERIAISNHMNTRTYIDIASMDEKSISIVKVIAIYDSLGNELSINDTTATPSIFTTSFDTLRIKNLHAEDVFSVVYQALYPEIVIDCSLNPEAYVLHIPEIIIEALLLYVAARIFQPIDASGAENQREDKSTNYHQLYELACQKIKAYGLYSQNNDSSTVFMDNGWV